MDSNRPPRGTCDLLVVGGGINGAGIARDAAGRGLQVVLCEQHDLAAHTSSASTKLIHGGLRYLEYHEYRLVRKALQEREVLLNAAPHITWPLRFVMPHDDHLRPRWLIRLGLFLYDHLAERRLLPDSRGVNLRRHVAGAALQPKFRRGFIYSDGWVDDARLVALNAVDLQQRGGEVRVRTRCAALARLGDAWRATLIGEDGAVTTVDARAVVNATGPWVRRFLDEVAEAPSRHQVRLVKGSHIVVPKLFDHGHAYLFQNPDQRIVFAIPYEQDFTLIGTTDVEFTGDAGAVHIDAAEVDYLCTQASRYFRTAVTPADVVWQYSGVRPLLEDAAASAASVTRDYLLEMAPDGPPLLSVFGGKLTTYRRLAEDAMDLLQPRLDHRAPAWTAGEPLPGGDLPHADFAAFLHGTEARYPWLPPALRLRYARAYGRRIAHVVGQAESMAGLGEAVLPGLHAAEIDYLRRHEWARTAEDMLWRRSKLGLHLPAGSAGALDAWLATHPLAG